MQPQTANEIREAFLERSAPGSTHRFADELVLEQFHLAGLGQHPILLKFLAAAVIDDVAEWKKAKIAAYSLLGKTRAKGPVLNAIGAKLFFEELLASVETLTGIVEEHGARTLADL